jgi:hypothetical protein
MRWRLNSQFRKSVLKAVFQGIVLDLSFGQLISNTHFLGPVLNTAADKALGNDDQSYSPTAAVTRVRCIIADGAEFR